MSIRCNSLSEAAIKTWPRIRTLRALRNHKKLFITHSKSSAKTPIKTSSSCAPLTLEACTRGTKNSSSRRSPRSLSRRRACSTRATSRTSASPTTDAPAAVSATFSPKPSSSSSSNLHLVAIWLVCSRRLRRIKTGKRDASDETTEMRLEKGVSSIDVTDK